MADTSRPDLVSRITGLLNEITTRMEQAEPIHPAAQQLLGQLAATLSYLPRLKNAEINVGQAELAPRALLSVNPETEFVQTIVEDLERRVAISWRTPLFSRL